MSSHFSDRKRWGSVKTKVEVLPSAAPYVPEEHPFDKREDWQDKQAGKQDASYRSGFGPTKEEAEAHRPIREAALKKLKEDSLALAEVHLAGAHKAHADKRFYIDPAIRPNKPMRKDFTISGLKVFAIGAAIFVSLVALKLFLLRRRQLK